MAKDDLAAKKEIEEAVVTTVDACLQDLQNDDDARVRKIAEKICLSVERGGKVCDGCLDAVRRCIHQIIPAIIVVARSEQKKTVGDVS